MKSKPNKMRVPLRESSATMSAYFDEVRAHPLLDADGEQRVAREIEARTERVWEAVLSFPPAAEVALALVRERLGGGRRRLPGLHRAIIVIARAPSDEARCALQREAQRVAPKLFGGDRDRELLDDVVAAALGLSPQPHGFTQFRRLLRAAERAAAKSRATLVNSNLRLVISVARRYENSGVPLLDLIQEGNLGLMKAVNRFDYRRGFRFSTYATWWIRHAVSRAVADTSRTIRLPVHLLDEHQRIANARRELTKRLQRAPSSAELGDELGLGVEQVDKVLSRARNEMISLDEAIGDDGDLPRLEVLRMPVNDERSPLEIVSRRLDGRRIGSLLEALGAMEQDVLRKRFALGEERAWTLREIGKIYGVSRERIRQIQEEALAKLRRAAAHNEETR